MELVHKGEKAFVVENLFNTANPSSVPTSDQRLSNVLLKKVKRYSLSLIDKSAITEGFSAKLYSFI